LFLLLSYDLSEPESSMFYIPNFVFVLAGQIGLARAKRDVSHGRVRVRSTKASSEKGTGPPDY
jgi:hypothetical protein